MNWKNRSGFTLIEIMIAIGVMGILSTVMMTLTKESRKTTAKFQSEIDATTIVNEMMGHLADPVVCGSAANFGGKSIVGLPGTIAINPALTQLQKKNLTNMYSTAGGPYGTSNLLISSYQFQDIAGAGDDVNALAAPGNRELYLVVTFSKKVINQTAASTPTFFKRIKIAFTTDANDTGTNINFCKAVSTGYDGIWQRGVITSNIFYNAGNVGIGTATPTSILHTVAGGAQTANYSGVLLSNTATSAAAIDKIGLEVRNSGAWSSALGRNIGLSVDVAGSPRNISAVFTGGGVGIGGVPSPNFWLEVFGQQKLSSPAPLWNLNETDTAKQWFFGLDNSDFWIREDSTAFANERFTVRAGGNVGVGTATPQYRLEVNGLAHAISGVIAPKIYPLGNAVTGFQINRADGVTNIVNVDTTNSRVGIGTTAPVYKLDVVGQINTNDKITIQGQSVAASELGGNVIGTKLTEVPTKQWVQAQLSIFFTDVSPQTLNGIAATIVNYTNSNTMNVIRQAICSTSRVRVNADAYSMGSFAGGVCSYNVTLALPPDCTVNGTCSDLYATNMHATQVNASSGICNGSGCITNFNRYRCPNGYWMYGFARGVPQCKQNGVLGVPVLPSQTASPVAY